ncbi:family 16 glycosylhydrolase [Paenibacillus albicereus]|uniref:Family 16 glycosylhydrolase n=1 Tax=Paenibacillus albicereus TaxID=2726185 RepID=A0A6H2GSU4_9BACL|nr:carbohydrate binding domain-containing protein [Paenibacillus albicereus]QJC50501.1 family 16 glycosylhydrolase [Paenibacillus albicereus]
MRKGKAVAAALCALIVAAGAMPAYGAPAAGGQARPSSGSGKNSEAIGTTARAALSAAGAADGASVAATGAAREAGAAVSASPSASSGAASAAEPSASSDAAVSASSSTSSGATAAASPSAGSAAGGRWSDEVMTKWAQLGLAAGDPDGSARPQAAVTRAELAQLMVRLFGLPAPERASAEFADVKPDAWHAGAIEALRAAGLATGYPDGSFRPSMAVTRQEAAVLASKLFRLADAGMTADKLAAYSDGAKAAAYARPALEALLAGGYLSGYGDGSLKPGAPVTREEEVALLDRLAGDIVAAPGTHVKAKAGNLVVKSGGVVVQGTEVAGDLYLAPGIGEGDVTLKGVRVKGRILVQGGGANSIHLEDSTAGEVVVDKASGPVRVVLEGSSEIGRLQAQSRSTIEIGPESEAGEVEIGAGGAGSELTIRGSAGRVTANGAGVTLNNEPVPAGESRAVASGAVSGGQASPSTSPSLSPSPSPSAAPPVVGPTSAPTATPTVAPTVAPTATPSAAPTATPTSTPTVTPTATPTVTPTATPTVTPTPTPTATSSATPTPTSTASPTPSPTSTPIESDWTLTWSDEFDGDAAQPDANGVDLSKWGYQLGNGAEYGVDGWGNNEQQFYRKENIQVEDGKLVIEARKESHGGKPYTSGRLWTSPTFSQTYGKFEARMKLPAGEGLWPAFWMMPQDSVYGVWASSGEIDIMEARGRLLNEVGGTLHHGKTWPDNRYTGKEYRFPDGEDITGFHTYGVEWEPGEIRWYVDGKLYQTQNEWSSQGVGQPDKYAFPAPFDQPFHLIVNLAVGGNYDGGRTPKDSDLPGRVEVDYVRAYELTGRDYRAPQEPSAVKEPIPADAKLPVDGSWIHDREYARGLTDIAAPGTELDPLNWNFLHTNEFGGAGTAKVETVGTVPMARITATDGGLQSYSLQLIQHATLVKGRKYKLTFDAKASAERAIAVKLGGDADNGWAAYTDQFAPQLGTEVKPFEYRFAMGNATDAAARLEFNVGLAAGDVWIGNVRLEEVERLRDPQAAKEPLESGNHVYNGDFDLGTMDRLSYWTLEAETAAGATASVDPSAREVRLATAAAGAPQDAALRQDGLQLLQSDDYELTFRARASSAGRTIGVELGSQDGSRMYASQQVALGTEMAEHKLAFTMPAGESDPLGRLSILFGGAAGEVHLDAVRLIRTSDRNVDYSGVDLFPLQNGDFSGGLASWEPFIQGAGAAFATDGGAARIDISNAGTEGWNVMLNQGNLNVKKGFVYKLEFDAKSSEARPLQATLENASYARRFDSGEKALTGDWQHFAYTFKPNADESLALKFLLGKLPGTPAGSHQVWIDNVVLEVAGAPVKRPVRLNADTAGNTAGSELQLTFADDAEWRAAVRSVAVNGRTLQPDGYALEPGVLRLLPEAGLEAGSATVAVRAEGYADASVQQPVVAADGNLLANGSFAAGEAGWTYWKGEGGDSAFAVEDGAAQADIYYHGGMHPQWNVPVSWSSQLIQGGIKLKGGSSYELTFRAWSDADRPIEVEWTNAAGVGKSAVRLTADSSRVHRVVVTPLSDSTVDLKFLLGNVIDGSATTPEAPHTIRIDDVALRELLPSVLPNVALHAAATASSASQPAIAAVDGDAGTRWESAFGDPQWIALDLGGLHRLEEIALHWEGAFASRYRVQLSSAEAPGEGDWSDAEVVAGGNGGVDRIILPSGTTARQVRILGEARGTAYGYSLWEVEVKGEPSRP